VVKVCQASRGPATVWNITSDALSPSLNVVDRDGPVAVRAAAAVSLPDTLLIARSRAAAALMPGLSPGAPRSCTGEPWMPIRRPSFATCAFSPLPNTGTPPAYCT